MRILVTLYTNCTRLEQLVRAAVPRVRIDVYEWDPWDRYPDRPDWVVTGGDITTTDGYMPSPQAHAMACGAQGAITLPEGAAWLAQQVHRGRVRILAGWPPAPWYR